MMHTDNPGISKEVAADKYSRVAPEDQLMSSGMA
jgi:hypothetical protein